MTAEKSIDPDDGFVSLEIPANSRFCALARVTAASLAAENDFDVDEIHDLRMAVNESVGALIDALAAPARIAITFDVDDGAVTVTCQVTDETAVAPDARPDELAERILDTVTDAHELTASSARVVKRRSP